MEKECEDVQAFHRKFDQLDPGRPVNLTKRKLAERFNFMLEELLEGAGAAGLALNIPIREPDELKFVADDAEQEIELQADALVDLVYVAKGTAVMMGLPWQELWDDVQDKNMQKVRGPTHRKMGFGADICKPPGWKPPETGAILRAAGYRRAEFISLDDPENIFSIYTIDDAKCVDDPGAKT